MNKTVLALVLPVFIALISLSASAAPSRLGALSFYMTNLRGPIPLPEQTYAVAYAYDDESPYKMYARIFGCTIPEGQSTNGQDGLEILRRNCSPMEGTKNGVGDLYLRTLYFPFDTTRKVSATRSERFAGSLQLELDTLENVRMKSIVEVHTPGTTRAEHIQIDFRRVRKFDDVEVPSLPAVTVVGHSR